MEALTMPRHRYAPRPGRRTDTLERVIIHLSPNQMSKLHRLANVSQTTADQYAEEIVQNYLMDRLPNREPNPLQRESTEAQLMSGSLNQ